MRVIGRGKQPSAGRAQTKILDEGNEMHCQMDRYCYYDIDQVVSNGKVKSRVHPDGGRQI